MQASDGACIVACIRFKQVHRRFAAVFQPYLPQAPSSQKIRLCPSCKDLRSQMFSQGGNTQMVKVAKISVVFLFVAVLASLVWSSRSTTPVSAQSRPMQHRDR